MPSKKPATIVINGRTYDAITGKLLTKKELETLASPKKRRHIPHNKGVSIDGFVPDGKRPPIHVSEKRRVQKVASELHEVTKKSRTLKRDAVPKPKLETAIPDVEPAKATPLTRHHLSKKIDPEKKARARRYRKSHAVSKFGGIKYHAGKQPTGDRNRIQNPMAFKASRAIVANTVTGTSDPVAKMLTKEILDNLPDQKPPRRPNLFKRLSLSANKPVYASLAATVLIVGYITYLNVPRIALRVASARAGITAQLPGYLPPGYRFGGPLAYTSGKITLTFKAPEKSGDLTLTEQATNWNSQALLENYVNPNSVDHLTYQENGLIIYVFNGNTATWVNGGIWYVLTDNQSNLSSDAFLRIASSL